MEDGVQQLLMNSIDYTSGTVGRYDQPFAEFLVQMFPERHCVEDASITRSVLERLLQQMAHRLADFLPVAFENQMLFTLVILEP